MFYLPKVKLLILLLLLLLSAESWGRTVLWQTKHLPKTKVLSYWQMWHDPFCIYRANDKLCLKIFSFYLFPKLDQEIHRLESLLELPVEPYPRLTREQLCRLPESRVDPTPPSARRERQDAER